MAHPYLKAADFNDRTFLRIRRRVALLRLPYADDACRKVILETIAVYDDLIGDKAAIEQS